MTREPEACSQADGSGCGDILLVGQSLLPPELRGNLSSGFLAVELLMDPTTGTIKQLSCRELTPAAEEMLREMLVSRNLSSAWEDCRASLQRRYFAPQKDTLMKALRGISQQYAAWSASEIPTKALTPPPAAPEAISAPTAEISSIAIDEPPASSPMSGSFKANGGDGSNGNSSAVEKIDSVNGVSRPAGTIHGRNNRHHGLASLLVTLLAHSRLLDGWELRKLEGVSIADDVRRQAIQLYAVVQQILHSIEAEPGLLQPAIQPIELSSLLNRALRRSSIQSRRLTVNNLVTSDLTPARGDALVLEEALVMLFDEIDSYTASTEATLEITAERRRKDILLVINLRDATATHPSENDTGAETPPTTLIEQMWRCGLGTLAARALVEHQGGRLWMQENFPKELPSLCLTLPSHQPVQPQPQPQLQ